jgi:hypothetical protein
MKTKRKAARKFPNMKFPFSHENAVKIGRLGGNPLLKAEGRGERITIHHKNGKTETIN